MRKHNGESMKVFFSFLLLIIAIVGVITFFGSRKHTIPFDKESPYDIATGAHGRKKILIFSSRGGGGHISVANALLEYLKGDYTIGTSYIFSDVLGRFDPVKNITQGKKTGEDFYNYLIKKKWHWPVNMTYDLGSLMYNINRRKIEAVLEQYIQKHKPDLVVSVIPVINNMVLNVSKKLDIPFLLVPTDLDPTIAINGIKNPSYDKFHLALSYNDKEILKKLEPAHIPTHNISFVGFPVKKAFLEPRRDRQTRIDFNIPDKPVILLLMGAQGSSDLYEFSKQLSKIKTSAHILIAIGKSEHLRNSLEKIQFPDHISYDIIGFTNRIPDLMAISDLFISKSGSVSVNEAIYAELPMLLDATSMLIQWEKFNHAFIRKHGFGGNIRRYTAVQKTVDEFFENKEKSELYKKNLEEFEKPNTEEKIKTLIYKILK